MQGMPSLTGPVVLLQAKHTALICFPNQHVQQFYLTVNSHVRLPACFKRKLSASTSPSAILNDQEIFWCVGADKTVVQLMHLMNATASLLENLKRKVKNSYDQGKVIIQVCDGA